MTHILLIEDESSIRDMIYYTLSKEDFSITALSCANEARDYLNESRPDLILLDWMLPQISGIDFLNQLKKQSKTSQIPVIMLTAKAEEHNKVRGLNVGADDYVTKPFSPKELVARIKTVLRRGLVLNPDHEIVLGSIRIKTTDKKVFINDTQLNLSSNEYKLLEHLARHQNHVLTRAQLLDHVWGINTEVDERAVDSQIKRLRNALQQFHCQHLIQTVRGYGYRCISEVNS